MEKYIPLIVGGIFLLFIIFGMFWGLVRGLKKSTFRMAWILTTAVILFFATPFITIGLMKVDISFIGIVVNETKILTANHLVECLIASIPDYGTLLVKNPNVINMCITLVGLFINSFIYVLCFWLAKIVLWPVWAILSAAFIKKKDYHGNKKPKHRLFGLMVGGITGAVVGATTLMPIMGVVNLASEVEAETFGTYTKTVTNAETGDEEEIVLEGGQISQLLGADAVKFINAYSDSFVSKAFKYTGIEFINNAAFSGLSSATVGDIRIVLKDEVKSVFKTIDSAKALSEINTENLNKEQITKILSAAKVLVNNVFSLNIVNTVGDNLLPIFMDELVNNPNFIIKAPSVGIVTFDNAIKQGLTELKDFKFTALKNEIVNILEVAEVLNNAGVLEQAVNNENVDFKEISALMTPDVVNDFNDKLFKMQTMSTLMPIMVNSGLTYLAETLEVEDFSIDAEHGNVESVKTLFKGITGTIFSISNSLDLDSKFYVTETTLPLVGKLINAVKNYEGITSSNYVKLVNAAENKLKNVISDMAADMSEDFEGIKNELLNAIGKLSHITNYETDFTLINTAYSNIKTVVEGLTAETAEFKLVEMGAVLDVFARTELFSASVNPIMVEGINLLKEFIPADFADLNDVMDNAKQNVPNVVSWENEFTILQNIKSSLTSVLEADDLKDKLLATDSTALTDLGSSFDELSESKLFGGEIKNIVKVLLDQIANFESGNDSMLSSSVELMKQNIDSASTINFEFEFGVLKTLLNGLMDLADDNSDSSAITQAGATFDEVLLENSVIVTEPVIKDIIIKTIDQLVSDDSDSDVNSIVSDIKTSINQTADLCYEHELTALNSMFNQINDLDTSGDSFYTDFGEILDSYDKTYGSTPSIVVSAVRPKIVKMVINKVDTSQMDSDMVTIVNKIKESVNQLEAANKQNKYKSEFEHIKTFVDKVNNLTQVDVSTFNFSEFGTMLDGFSSSILLKPVRADVLNFVANKAQSSLTSSVSQISTAITEILTHTKTLSAQAEAGTLTYNTIFTDLGEVKNLTDGLASVEVTRSTAGFNAIEQLGVKLNGLKELVVVPTTAVVRIAQYATSQIVGDNGIKTIIPAPQNETERVQLESILNTALSEIEPINTKYVNYLSNPDSTTFDFAADFTSIKNVIVLADQALTKAGK